MLSRKIMILFAFCALAVIASFSFAYSPLQSFTVLEEDSDLIAIVKVISKAAVEGSVQINHRLEYRTAEIQHVIKGTPANKGICIIIDSTVAEDPLYPEDSQLLVFLRHSGQGDAYRTTNSRYGAKVLPEESLEHNRRVISQYLRLKGTKDKEMLADWAVETVRHKSTRWILAFDSGELSRYLRKNHYDSIYKFLAEETEWTEYEARIVSFLPKYYRKQFKDHL